jgi:hypothetical protein
MSKITPLMTALHMGHKAEERIKCIDNMLFKKCEDTKETILQAFWWYRKHSIPLEKVKQAREEIENEVKFWSEPSKYNVKSVVAMKNAKAQSYKHCLEILDKIIAESEER